jgi:hypothetical protein
VRKVFISYARQNEPEFEQLVKHLRVLGCDIWYDSLLHGGQDWWEEILRRIADCDTFIAIISRDALSSTACQREFDWAESLDKPVIPIAVESLTFALPTRLLTRQIVDYADPRARDLVALRLAGDLAVLPPTPPLADPLPEPPAAPLSHLTRLSNLASQRKTLNPDEQRQILNKLEGALRSEDPEERRGGKDILEMLSRRDDLFADLYREIIRMRTRDSTAPSTAARSAPVPQAQLNAPPAPADAAAREPTFSPTGSGDRLSSSVFAPPEVRNGDNFLVYVFAHVPEDEALVESLARKYYRRAEPAGSVGLSKPIRDGDSLAFELLLPGLVVDDPVQSMVWFGRAQSVQFEVTVPPDFTRRDVVGTVTISRDSVPLGHVKFSVSVCQAETVPAPELSRSQEMRRYNRAFISYASADRKEVLKRTQMLAGAHIDFFQDLLSLDPGQRWERQLYREIDRCDVFYLFWSSAAKNSRWVLEEVQYAMARNGGDEFAPPEILPVIIEGPPPVEAPPELAHLHFNDRMIYFMQPIRKSWFSRLGRRSR